MLRQLCNPDCIRDGSFDKAILSCIECYEITNKVLRVGVFFWMLACRIFTLFYFCFLFFQETNLHIELRDHFIRVLTKLPNGDKLKQRVMDILARWEQLLLSDFSGGGWTRTSPESCIFSLVYVSKSKFHGERYVSAQTVASPNTSFLNTELRMSPDAGQSIVYGLKLFYEDWLDTSRCYSPSIGRA